MPKGLKTCNFGFFVQVNLILQPPFMLPMGLVLCPFWFPFTASPWRALFFGLKSRLCFFRRLCCCRPAAIWFFAPKIGALPFIFNGLINNNVVFPCSLSFCPVVFGCLGSWVLVCPVCFCFPFLLGAVVFWVGPSPPKPDRVGFPLAPVFISFPWFSPCLFLSLYPKGGMASYFLT